MVELRCLYMLLYTGAAVLALTVALAAWRRRAALGALPLAVLMFGVAIWSGADAAMWYASTLEQQVFWLKARELGLWMVPVAVLAVTFSIAGIGRWRTPRRMALISFVSFALSNIAWPNPGHLYFSAFVAQEIGSYTRYEPVPGPLYWVFVAFIYASLTIASVVTFRVFLRSSGAERTQAAILLVGGLMPFSAGVVTQMKLVALSGLDLAPLAFVVSCTLWLFAILRGTVFDIVPLARGALVQQMRDGIIVVDGNGLIVDANPAALSMLGAPVAEVIGKFAETVIGGVKGAADVLCGSSHRRSVLPIESGNEIRYVAFGVVPFVGTGGLDGQILTLHDVTEERRAGEGLRRARRVFDTATEGILVVQPGEDKLVVDVNEAYCRLTGYSRGDVIGKSMDLHRSDRNPPGFYEGVEETLLSEGEWEGEIWQARADGTVFRSWLSLTRTRDDEGQMGDICGVFTDMTQIQEAEERLEFNATHDALTRLPNRLLLDDRLEHALAQTRRAGSGLAVFFLDLDNFKGINDMYGHAQGDILLIEVARRMAAVLREGDTVGRRGGDEFTVILTDIENPAQVEVTAKRLLEAVESRLRVGNDDVRVTASIGIALFPTDGVDLGSLTQHADVAMYSAKEQGRNRVQFFSAELQTSLNQRTAVVQELWAALEEGRYFLLYQPHVDLFTGRITGVEALVRLRSRDGTVISPTEFIPVAESSELIIRLGEWVLRAACAELAALHEVAPDLTMAVNFSARQLREVDVTSLLGDALLGSGVEARFLEIEITESVVMTGPQEVATKLEDLRRATGIRLSLDDFGTGYSSLTYLHVFRADTIKIDRSFVSLLPGSLEAQAIVLSIIALARALGATVIAEGPETEEQVRFLRANGCNSAQGFYFSRPIPADELMLLLCRGPFAFPDN